MHWYKRDPDAALAGMVELTLEERGAYNTIIDLLYARNGQVPDEDRFICTHLRCRRQKWRRIRDSLILKGKIWVNSGNLMAKRVESAMIEAGIRSDKSRFSANKRWSDNEKLHALGNASTTTTRYRRGRQ